MSYTGITINNVANGDTAWLCYDIDSGFRVFKQITDGIAVYYQDVSSVSPPSALIQLSSAVSVDNTLVKDTSGTGDFSSLQDKESQLVKIGSNWCVLNKYINTKTIVIDRPLSAGGTLSVPRYYPDIINDIIVGRITKTGGVYALEPYFQVKAENNSTVEFVATLPSTGNYVGRTVVLATDNLLYSWDGTQWVQGNPTTVTESATAPPDPIAGALWFRTTDSRMFIWDGTQWVQAVTGLSGTRQIDITTEEGIYDGETVLDTNTNGLYVWDALNEEWDPVITDVIRVDLSNQAHTISCTSDGTPVNYDGAETLISIYSGESNVTSLWTITPTPSTGVTGSLTTVGANKKYTVTAVTQDSSYVDFEATRTGYVSRQVRFTLTKVRAGVAGGAGVVYRINNSAGAIKESSGGTFTPSTVTFYGYEVEGTSAPVAYSGRFKIYTSTNGISFTLQYTSSVDQSEYTYTIPSGTKFLKGELYYEQGTTVLLDFETIPIVSDGVQGFTGVQGGGGVQGGPGVQGGSGPQGTTGIQGETGGQGTTGATGSQGITGTQGGTGQQGTTGAIGSQGTTGLQGGTGQQGTTGATGSQGATGLQGGTGQQGTTGATGSQGATGLQGGTGQQGTTGATGAQGATGLQGGTGQQGTTGATGAQGATGV